MATLNIVMVEPEIPQNTGNVARTCAATGARLHLVGPMGFQIDDKKLKRAGLDYWHMLDITMYSSLSDFFEKNPLEGVKFSVQVCYNGFANPDLLPGQRLVGVLPTGPTLTTVICFLEKKPPVCQNHFYMNIPTQRFVFL